MTAPDRPYLATDVIIEYPLNNKQGVVLIERKFRPFGIALAGGHAEYGLSLEENARKESREETGLEVVLESPEHPFCVHSDPKRDPRRHMVAVVYIGRGNGDIKAGDDAKAARWYSIPEVISMLGKNRFAFDHERIITKYLQHRGYA